MSVSDANPCATPGGMNTPRWSWVPSARLPRSSVRVAPSVGEPVAQVVQDDPGPSAGDVPVVGLVQVVVEPDDGTRLAVAPVALHHLAAVREPLAPVRLDEDAALVPMDGGLDDVHAGDDVGLGDRRHPATCWRRSAGRSR